MNHASPLWQDLVTLALVLMAAAYLARRWWPTWVGLWRVSDKQAPGCSSAADAVKAPSACGGGCANCSASGSTPPRDHRINVTRQTTRN